MDVYDLCLRKEVTWLHHPVEVRQHQRMLDKAISRAHFLGHSVNALSPLTFERIAPEVPKVSLSFRPNSGELLFADNPLEDNIAPLHQLLVLSLKLFAANTDLTLGLGEAVGSCKILILIVNHVVDLPELLIVTTA